MQRPMPVTQAPKYAVGFILEDKNGNFGRVMSVKAVTRWTEEGVAGIPFITYACKSGGGGSHYELCETAIVRVISET